MTLLCEALDKFASPQTRDRILRHALEQHGGGAVPSLPHEIEAFLNGALRDALDTYLGEDAADAILEDLAPILQLAARAPASNPGGAAQGGYPASHARARQSPQLPPSGPAVGAHIVGTSAPAPADTEPAAQTISAWPPPPRGRRNTPPVPFIARVPSPAPKVSAPPVRPPLSPLPTPPRSVPPSDDLPPIDMRISSPPSVQRAPRLLVVDGDTANRSVITRQLRSAGYEVVAAPDGHIGLAVCVRHQPAVVIASLTLPTVDGVQFAALLRVALGADAPPVILITDDPGLVPRNDGIARVLHKPLSGEQLLDAVEELIGAVELRMALSRP